MKFKVLQKGVSCCLLQKAYKCCMRTNISLLKYAGKRDEEQQLTLLDFKYFQLNNFTKTRKCISQFKNTIYQNSISIHHLQATNRIPLLVSDPCWSL